MVQMQLCTLDHLINSGFGRPFPRHGLQLLFWFAKDCVTCELIKCVLIMKMVLGCDPENGCYGFHQFGNNEELLPVLDSTRKGKKRVVYYEVGNLNAETYLGSENLPSYVTQNFGFEGDDNTDRLIISYQVRSRVVETVYVTQHDGAFSGRFSPDNTYEISFELIQALRSPDMDVTSFLTQMGYYGVIPVVKWCNDEYIQNQSEQMFSAFDNYSVSTVRIEQRDADRCYAASVCGGINVIMHNNQPTYNKPAYYSGVQHNYWRPEASETPRAAWPSYPMSGLEEPYRGFDKEDKKSSGGSSIIRILLGAGALLLAVKCFSWLKSCWQVDENISKSISRITRVPRIPLSFRNTHVMLDYVY